MTRIFKGRKVAVSICEDVWNVDSSLHSQNPISEICEEKPDLLINLSASPWHQGKQEQRIKLLSKVVKLVDCPLCYVNSIGGNDELVFDVFKPELNEIINLTRNEMEQAYKINVPLTVDLNYGLNWLEAH